MVLSGLFWLYILGLKYEKLKKCIFCTRGLNKNLLCDIIIRYGGDWFRQALTDHNIKHMVNGGNTLIFRQKINAEKNSDSNVVNFNGANALAAA